MDVNIHFYMDYQNKNTENRQRSLFVWNACIDSFFFFGGGGYVRLPKQVSPLKFKLGIFKVEL